MDLKHKIKDFPNQPGVYRFLDINKQILYIGRATNLRKRVAQYFRKDLDPRIAEMVEQAKDIKYQTTDTVLEAILLEARKIKEHWPKYNIRDKDDKSFVYLVFPLTKFSYPILIRGHELKKFPVSKNKIFGPFQNQYLIKNALKIIRRIFPYSTCTPNQGKACFDYQIGLCPGTCIGEIDEKEYQKNIHNIIMLFAGQKKRLMTRLKTENPEQAEAFEKIQEVTLLTQDEIESTKGVSRIEAYDISHLTGQDTYGAMAVMTNGKPDKSQYRLFKIKSAPKHDDLRALAEMLTRRFNHPEWPRPDLILIDGGKPQIDYLNQLFQDRNLSIPLVGLSKYAEDKLVYPGKTKTSIKVLVQSIKPLLLQIRDEAHRFSNRARTKSMRKRIDIIK